MKVGGAAGRRDSGRARPPCRRNAMEFRVGGSRARRYNSPMQPKNLQALADRVVRAAEAALATQQYVSPIDVLVGVGWLDPGAEKRWRLGQIDCLERAVQANLSRISAAMKLFRSWAAGKGLNPSETRYVARTPQRSTLRFSRSGAPGIERAYRTHWVSPALSEKKRERLAEKASAEPELVAILPLKDWACHKCGGGGDFLMMEKAGPVCLSCAGLADLVFVPAGDALLTRRVKAKSARRAVVVRFSKARGRYERQGLLAEPQAAASARREVSEQRGEAPAPE